MTARVVLHIPEIYHGGYDRAPHLALYPLVREVVQGLGGEVVLGALPAHLFRNQTLSGDGDLHIVEGGRVQGEGYLNAALAYLRGYWHLDPIGVLGESSLGSRRFDPIAVAAPEVFFETLQQRFVLPRLSRYGQPKHVIRVPKDSIAVFLQGPAPFHRGLAYMSSAAMVRCVAEGAGGRPVIVKPHPLKREAGMAVIKAAQDEGYAIQTTEANVHDILAACAVTVSVNSAASVEGFLHGKPGILFGQSDLAQFMQSVRVPDDFSFALAAALSKPIDYATAITWYFQHQCLALDAPDFTDRLLTTFAKVGFGPDRLGLKASITGVTTLGQGPASPKAAAAPAPHAPGPAGSTRRKALWQGLRSKAPEAKLVFHVPSQYLETHQYLALFRRLDEVFRPRGALIEVRDRKAGPRDSEAGAAEHYNDGNLHIVDMGRVRGPGILNAAISYIPPYWHLDAAGVQAESSIGAKVYDPRQISYEKAGPFFEDMRAGLATARKSRRDQMERVTEFAPGAIGVFLQGLRPLQQGLAYCTPIELLRAVCAGAGGRQVLVKPHPLASEDDAEVIDAALAEGLPVTVTMANVHDIIAASVCTVSFNSAVALEGFLHRKPAILFGQSDFHHICETVRKPEDFAGALARTLARAPGGYAQFMFWYLGMNCLHLYGPAFEARVMAIFEAAGFEAERLGLH